MPAPPAPNAPQPRSRQTSTQTRAAQLRDLQKRLAEIESGSGIGPRGDTADGGVSVGQGGGEAAAKPGGRAESLARTIVLRQLAAAPKSRAQLAAAMAKHEVPEDVAEAILDRFEAVGLVDDVALAQMLVRTRHIERGLTGPALAVELRRRGLSDEVAAAAMGQISRDDECEHALALARRKLAATTGLDREVRRRRTYALLARKGYSPSVARRALDEALGEEGVAECPKSLRGCITAESGVL